MSRLSLAFVCLAIFLLLLALAALSNFRFTWMTPITYLFALVAGVLFLWYGMGNRGQRS